MNNIRIKPVWSKSKDEIWNEKFEHLDEHRPREKGLLRRISVWGYAASLFIPILLICQFYTITTETARGEHAVVMLPDRSTITMNVESVVSYKPLTWFVSRKVKLQGEACFEVKHGSSFDVHSAGKQVKVLGTTFNVFARAEKYCVTCLTGQVAVQVGKESVVLHSNMQAVFDEWQLRVYNNTTPSAVTGWIQGMFVFVETPLHEVIAEVERQYNITVTPDNYPKHFYTGKFSKTDNNPEEVLEIIGKAFDISFAIK